MTIKCSNTGYRYSNLQPANDWICVWKRRKQCATSCSITISCTVCLGAKVGCSLQCRVRYLAPFFALHVLWDQIVDRSYGVENDILYIRLHTFCLKDSWPAQAFTAFYLWSQKHCTLWWWRMGLTIMWLNEGKLVNNFSTRTVLLRNVCHSVLHGIYIRAIGTDFSE